MTRGTGGFDQNLDWLSTSGFAKANSTMAPNGQDAVQRLAIFGRIAFGTNWIRSQVSRFGIKGISLTDIEYVSKLGCTVKLLAIGKQTGVLNEAGVHRAMIPQDSV